MNPIKNIRTHNWFKILITIEGLLCLLWLISIPSDPKNAFLLGFSVFRWIQILILLAGTITLTLTFDKLTQFFQNDSRKRFFKIISILSIILLCFVLFTPAYRLKPYGAEFERFRPLLAFGLLYFSNFYFYLKFKAGEIRFENLNRSLKPSRNSILISGIVLFFIIVWFLLKHFFSTQLQGDLLNAPPAPVSSLQVFILLVIIWFLYQRGLFHSTNKKHVILISLVLFVSTALLWILIPMPCLNDRIGPFPPNYVCYPPPNDAVYSIASHFGRLGAGIYNHWFTDKPFYIFFLMITQWLSSPNIDHYISVQIIFLSLIPVLLFLFTKRIHGFFSGLLVSLLMIIREANNITGYRYFGAINSRLEATEVFITLFLILFGIILFYWFKNKNSYFLPVFAGVILGLTSLIRLNPVFILPVTILSLFLLFKKNFKRSIFISIIFTLGFLSSFMPWYLFSTDRYGQNHLFLKLNEIIQTRYQSTKYFDGKITKIENDFLYFKNASPVSTDSFIEAPINTPVKIGLHLLNNNFEILATLPVDFTFHTLKFQSGLPGWKDYSGIPIWGQQLSIINIIFINLNLFLILLGIYKFYNKLGFASLTPLIIQIGYTLGNGLAITSGTRYIIPIIWVSYLYFSIGVVGIIGKFQKILNITNFVENQEVCEADFEKSSIFYKNQKILISIILLISFFFSFGLTKLDIIQNKLDKPSENISFNFGDYLDVEQLELISKIENVEIFYGYSFQPKHYRNNFYNTAPASFELVTLTNDKVIVSYINDFQEEYFTDESETIIIGCPIKEEIRWGADFLIVDAFAVVQLDNEKSVYISNIIDWDCENN